MEILAGVVNILLHDIPEISMLIKSRTDCVEAKILHLENPELMLILKDLEKMYKRMKGLMAFRRKNTILLDFNILDTIYILASNIVHHKNAEVRL